MDLIQTIFAGVVVYGLFRLVKKYKKKEDLPEIPLAKVKTAKKKKEAKKKKIKV